MYGGKIFRGAGTAGRILVLAGLLAGVVLPQVDRGSLSGTILDQQLHLASEGVIV